LGKPLLHRAVSLHLEEQLLHLAENANSVGIGGELELKSKAESELRSVQLLKPEEAAVLALLRRRLAKETERTASTKKQQAKAA
jgi:hypothetical protein